MVSETVATAASFCLSLADIDPSHMVTSISDVDHLWGWPASRDLGKTIRVECAGLLVSAVQLGPLLSMLLIGYILDLYGERWVVSLGSCLLGLAFLLVAFTWDYWLLLVGLGVVGIWYGTAQPGGSKVILRWFSKHERGLAMGIRQAGIPIGGAVGGMLIPSLSLKFG